MDSDQTISSALLKRRKHGKAWTDALKVILAIFAVASSHFAGFISNIPPPIRSIAGVSLADAFIATSSFYIGTIVLFVVIVKYAIILFWEWKNIISKIAEIFFGIIKFPFMLAWFVILNIPALIGNGDGTGESFRNFILRASSYNGIEHFPVKPSRFGQHIVKIANRFGFAMQALLAILLFTFTYVKHPYNFEFSEFDLDNILYYIPTLLFVWIFANSIYTLSQRDLLVRALSGGELPAGCYSRLRSASLCMVGFILIFSYWTGYERFVTVSSQNPAVIQDSRLSGPFNIVLRSNNEMLLVERLGDYTGRYLFVTNERIIYDISSDLPALSGYKYYGPKVNENLDARILYEAYKRPRVSYPSSGSERKPEVGP